jgi:ketosteroid isomerase-like protein
MRHLLIAAALLAAPLPALAQSAPYVQAETPVVAEARAFMAEYAARLTRPDVDAVGALYSTRGAHWTHRSASVFETQAEITQAYKDGGWGPAAKFEWVGLRYEPLTPDAVLVSGTFLWHDKDGSEPKPRGYTALLARDEDGQLRIRLEHE